MRPGRPDRPSGPDWPRQPGVRIARALLAAAARLLPFHRRRNWRDEWEGELWALARRHASPMALVRFGMAGVGHAWFEHREEEGGMGGIGRDVAMALRQARRNPGFTFTVVLVLALGIGANSALYSAVHAALLAEPPYPAVERMVVVDLTLGLPDSPGDTMGWSYPKFEAARERLTVLEALAGYSASRVTLTGAGDPARLPMEFVTPSYFELVGAGPILGRAFAASEEVPADARVVVLSHGLWMTRFGGDRSILGRTVRLDGVDLEVVGVMPRGFSGLSGSARLWVPMAGVTALRGPRRLQLAWAHWVNAIGRLRPGIEREEAVRVAERVGDEVTELFPASGEPEVHGVALTPLLAVRVNPLTRTAVGAVAAAAALFLLIACGNVAGLLLARQSARSTDLAVRAALGAGRLRLLREGLVETLSLSLAGGLVGALFAFLSGDAVVAAVTRALDTAGGRGLTYLDPEMLRPGPEVVAAAAVLAVVGGVAVGLFPALAATRSDLTSDLRSGSAGGGGARRAGARGSLRASLVAVQLALTVVLLAGAGLMAASLTRLSDVATGFSGERVLTLGYDRGPGFDAEENHRFIAEARARLAALPGIRSVDAVTCPPLTSPCEVVGVSAVDDRPTPDDARPTVIAYPVTDGYFETIGAARLEGRGFGPGDGPYDPPVVLLSRTAASTLFPGGPALGHRIALTHESTADAMAEVVGVVDDVRYGGLEDAIIPVVYLSERQSPMPYGTLMVSTLGDPLASLSAVRTTMAAIAPELPLEPVGTLADATSAASARTRVIVGLLLAFAGSGLLLSAVGLYGLVSYSVSRRTREVGLRMALGADRRSILGMIAAPQMALAGIGIALGLAGAVYLARFLGALLFEVAPHDPRVLVSATVVLLVVVAGAALGPARRAARIAPSEALRYD